MLGIPHKDHGPTLDDPDIAPPLNAAERLAQPQRHAAIDLLTGEFAHDFNNLLAVVIGVTERLALDLPAGSAEQKLALVGLQAAERGVDAVHRLLVCSSSAWSPSQQPRLSISPPGPIDARSSPAPGPPRSPELDPAMSKILVIDDDPRLLNLMTVALTRAGFETYAAENGREGAKIFKARRPDLVVTDILMPEKEGIETIMELKRDPAPPRIIAISGGGRFPGEDFLRWAIMLGADEVLLKPFRVTALVALAASLLGTAVLPRARPRVWAH
ncbi:MAG: cheY [Caulobacteraceae bacterium]|nr:cheY [Caulobacteraceae bacterium]